MASKSRGAYQCWLQRTAVYASLASWLVGQLSACHSIRDSQRSVLSDGTASFCYTVQDINSSILRRSGTGVGQATDAADTRARRLSRGGATRARVGEAAPAAARSWRAHATCRRHVQPLPASVLYGTRALSPSAVTCRPAARQPCTRARRCRKSTCHVTVCGGACEKSVCKGEPLPCGVVRGARRVHPEHMLDLVRHLERKALTDDYDPILIVLLVHL